MKNLCRLAGLILCAGILTGCQDIVYSGTITNNSSVSITCYYYSTSTGEKDYYTLDPSESTVYTRDTTGGVSLDGSYPGVTYSADFYDYTFYDRTVYSYSVYNPLLYTVTLVHDSTETDLEAATISESALVLADPVTVTSYNTCDSFTAYTTSSDGTQIEVDTADLVFVKN